MPPRFTLNPILSAFSFFLMDLHLYPRKPARGERGTCPDGGTQVHAAQSPLTTRPAHPAGRPESTGSPCPVPQERYTEGSMQQCIHSEMCVHGWACQTSMTHLQRDSFSLAGSCRVPVAPVVWEMTEPGSNPGLFSVLCVNGL